MDNVHIFEGNKSSLKDLRIVQKPEIVKRIKQNIKLSDFDYDLEQDGDFGKHLETNPNTKTPP